MADSMYQTAGGTATAITLTIEGTLVNGYPVTFIASANNNGSATTINDKNLYKPNTTTVPNLIAGKAYTVWYSTSNSGCFFIKASAEGSTVAGHVLAGDTFSNDNDIGLNGTMPNNGSINGTITDINGSYIIPLGYTNGGIIKIDKLITAGEDLILGSSTSETSLVSTAIGTFYEVKEVKMNCSGTVTISIDLEGIGSMNINVNNTCVGSKLNFDYEANSVTYIIDVAVNKDDLIKIYLTRNRTNSYCKCKNLYIKCASPIPKCTNII